MTHRDPCRIRGGRGLEVRVFSRSEVAVSGVGDWSLRHHFWASTVKAPFLSLPSG